MKRSIRRALNLTVVVALFVSVSLPAACRGVKPDQAFETIVDCAKVNPQNSQALGAITRCLAGAVMANPSACVTGLIVGMKYDDPEIEKRVTLRWAVEEVACVTSYLAQEQNQKVALARATEAEIVVRDNAVRWIVDGRYAFKNTYAGGPPR